MNIKNIFILILFALMLVSGIYAMKLYDKINQREKEAAILSDSLKVAYDSVQRLHQANILLTQQNDSLFKRTVAHPTKEIIESYLTNTATLAKLNAPNAYQRAIALEKEGFAALIDNKFDVALLKFTEAEKTVPSFHMAYEISGLLKGNRDNFNDPARTDDMKRKIVTSFSWGAPTTSLNQLKAQLKNGSSPVKNTY